MSQGRPTLTGDTSLELPEFDHPPVAPLALVRKWLTIADERSVREPRAATLATVDAEGHPSTRTLMIKEVDERGLIFNSSTNSRKGRELEANPWASLTFFWRETLQQLTAAGKVEVLSDSVCDEYFAARPRAAQAAAAVSHQSAPLDDEEAMRKRVSALIESGRPIARPETWVAYRLVPHSVEFWYGSPDRMHRRLRFNRPTDQTREWNWQRLQP
ncbi:phenazine biosynthesis FMN-dependent oxidase PhzG [Natronoglycomyces albus]|uniref:Pyridoxamine 5'-phosphate oxidase n=1 Tax=Natronoglycomyces albus TaxID=2811108 RepID=A0A895XQM6_9ACTN|nr:phenazine biosynthesis FMN-dependent oxidase PhzG [Natronoglycomyces albus]QSB04866.1 phenazine biosynthesis FMN-dependent oxidase PhzG [Natronoglycomyces albus]